MSKPSSGTKAFLAPIGEPPSIQLVPPARLKIDESYQRTIAGKDSQAAIARYAHAWDWRLCVPLLVSQRDDGLYVIDGQHRLEAAQRRGDIPYLPCCVSQYGSAADEAATFVAANRKRRAVSRVDTFRAALLAGDPVATAIAAELPKGSFSIARSSSANALQPGELTCIGTLEKMLVAHGGSGLGVALSVIGGAFPGEILRQSAALVQAVCGILASGHKLSDPKLLQETLARQTADEWSESARMRPSAANGGKGKVWALRAAITERYAEQAGMITPPVASPAPEAPTPAPKATGAVKPKRTFEEQMEAVARGATLVEIRPIRRPDPEYTSGGVGSSML